MDRSRGREGPVAARWGRVGHLGRAGAAEVGARVPV